MRSELSGERKKYYAVTEIDADAPQLQTRMHEHISSAIDEAINKAKEYLKNQGYVGKFQANVNVFVKEEGEKPRLIQTVKTKIIVQ